MNFDGVIIGFITFLMIGIFHVIVIKAEYYFTKRSWPCFLLAGFVCLGGSLLAANVIASSSLAILGITCLWSINELLEQEKRVEKGWFPKNPKRDGKKS